MGSAKIDTLFPNTRGNNMSDSNTLKNSNDNDKEIVADTSSSEKDECVEISDEDVNMITPFEDDENIDMTISNSNDQNVEMDTASNTNENLEMEMTAYSDDQNIDSESPFSSTEIEMNPGDAVPTQNQNDIAEIKRRKEARKLKFNKLRENRITSALKNAVIMVQEAGLIAPTEINVNGLPAPFSEFEIEIQNLMSNRATKRQNRLRRHEAYKVMVLEDNLKKADNNEERETPGNKEEQGSDGSQVVRFRNATQTKKYKQMKAKKERVKIHRRVSRLQAAVAKVQAAGLIASREIDISEFTAAAKIYPFAISRPVAEVQETGVKETDVSEPPAAATTLPFTNSEPVAMVQETGLIRAKGLGISECTASATTVPLTKSKPASKGQISGLAGTKVIDTSEKQTAITKAIVDMRYPDILLTRIEADIVQGKLLDTIDTLRVGVPTPQFSNTRFNKGILWVTCANSYSAEWLCETIGSFDPLWRDSRLTVISGDKLPQRSKVLLSYPDPNVKVEVIKERLAKQNPGLKTSDWSVLNCKTSESGHNIYFSIDMSSLHVLKKNNFKVYCGMGKVTFQNLSRGKSSIDERSAQYQNQSPAPSSSNRHQPSPRRNNKRVRPSNRNSPRSSNVWHVPQSVWNSSQNQPSQHPCSPPPSNSNRYEPRSQSLNLHQPSISSNIYRNEPPSPSNNWYQPPSSNTPQYQPSSSGRSNQYGLSSFQPPSSSTQYQFHSPSSSNRLQYFQPSKSNQYRPRGPLSRNQYQPPRQ